jgi:putative addiction module killer protein
MFEVTETEEFADWLKRLRDPVGRRQITGRIARIASTGNFGDHGGVGDGVSELRIHVGPGYRVYYTVKDRRVVFLLCAGDKGSQEKDIGRAREMAAALE